MYSLLTVGFCKIKKITKRKNRTKPNKLYTFFAK